MTSHSETINRTVVVMPAAGRGTRMSNPRTPKVCLDIGGEPAINRQISVFKGLGVGRFLIVLGSGAAEVLDTVNSRHPNLSFAYQNPQLGTGHAARIAAGALEQLGFNGNILLTMGDKFVEPSAVETLVAKFTDADADLALLTVPKTAATEDACGRVFVDSAGAVVDIIERIDIARQAVADQLKRKLTSDKPVSASEILKAIDRHITNPQKRPAAVGDLLDLANRPERLSQQKLRKILSLPRYNIRIAGKGYSARQIENKCGTVNPSLYLFKAEAFYRGVEMIDNDNAQGEYYLTDIVRHLASAEHGKVPRRIIHAPISNSDWIQGFNNDSELEIVRDYVRRKADTGGKIRTGSSRPRLSNTRYRAVGDWIDSVKADGAPLRRWLRAVYGPDSRLAAKKKSEFMDVLTCYGDRFGVDEKVCIVRAPGRVNVMGRHVDHRGAYNNFLAIDRETIAVAGLRTDDRVVAVNTDPDKFQRFEFRISQLLDGFEAVNWKSFVDSKRVRTLLRESPGHWSNYIKAATLRLQHYHRLGRISGLNIALTGDVPIAAGLSSSSTLVVATLKAAAALNNVKLTDRQFIDLCGEGEWFVGSRGGSGDHAAISLSSRGKITQVGYHPFRLEKTMPMPAGHRFIIANSRITAAKSLVASKGAKSAQKSAARDTFNARITSYDLGLELLKQQNPQLAERINHIRDLDPKRLGCDAGDIYRLLLDIPVAMTRKQFRDALDDRCGELIDRSFATHGDPGRYIVRGVLLFGVAETVRSRICAEYLEQGKIVEFGRLMNISHDGNRVSRIDENGEYATVADPCIDACLDDLIRDLKSEDPARTLSAQLSMQSGGYACSTPEIDKMVDIACSVPGVIGAQIAGAGLGGCIMILAHDKAAKAAADALVERYYEPTGRRPEVIDCMTVAGACLARF